MRQTRKEFEGIDVQSIRLCTINKDFGSIPILYSSQHVLDVRKSTHLNKTCFVLYSNTNINDM